jgi:DNA-binding XRE family transcriptional regulator
LNISISVYANRSIAQIVSPVKETLSQRFGRCVRSLRLQAGLTQVEFGELCGFYQTYLSRLEAGKANPTLNAMEVIAGGLGLTVFELWDHVREV